MPERIFFQEDEESTPKLPGIENPRVERVKIDLSQVINIKSTGLDVSISLGKVIGKAGRGESPQTISLPGMPTQIRVPFGFEFLGAGFSVLKSTAVEIEFGPQFTRLKASADRTGHSFVAGNVSMGSKKNNAETEPSLPIISPFTLQNQYEFASRAEFKTGGLLGLHLHVLSLQRGDSGFSGIDVEANILGNTHLAVNLGILFSRLEARAASIGQGPLVVLAPTGQPLVYME